MSVADILAAKGNEVISVAEPSTLHEVTTVLAKHKIGAVIVLEDNGDVCGIASERDIVRQIAANGPEALGDRIDSCMTRNVIFCEKRDSIDTILEKMTKGRFRHLPVMEDGSLVGFISIGDVVKLKIAQTERDAEELKRYIAG